MRMQSIEQAVKELPCDALVVGVHAGGQMNAALTDLDQTMHGAISKLIDCEEITGKCLEITEFLAPSGLAADRLIVVGLGDRQELDQAAVFRAIGAAAKRLASRPRERIVYCVGKEWSHQLGVAAVCGAIVGCSGQDLYRSKKRLQAPGEVLWQGLSAAVLQQAEILGESVNLVRQLVNASPSVVTPVGIAEQVVDLGEQHGFEVDVWNSERLEKERCNALLAVARAAANKPRLVVLQYRGADDKQPTQALVGKGVTFDSGGLSLKPSDSMKTMKCDMAGAATVVGTITAIARLRLPVNVVGVVGLVENMIGGNAYKLGEVLTARNGKTIEVLNTDAEGRLVLADALDVALEHQPAQMITLATLTGACMVALGTDVAGIMTNDQACCDQLLDAADHCGEPAWQLPMFAEYGEQIKSEIADIKNIGEGRWGGAITAAKFLEQFVGETPWIHIDIAGPAFLEKPKPWIDAGGTGVMLRTLVTLLRP